MMATPEAETRDRAVRNPPDEERLRLLALVRSDQPVPHVQPVEEGLSIHRGNAEWFLQNVPCQAACPLGTDVPGFLAGIADGDFEAALAINRGANLFPNLLCYICSRPCEGACRRASVDAPLAIRALKRAAATYASDGVRPSAPAPSGYRVAVVGSGPAGLAAAHDLARQGHDVVVLERESVPGGMLVLGIPPFRLPRADVEKEIHRVEQAGVRFLCDVEVGRDITPAQLKDEYDAVLLAMGCQAPVRLNLPGEDLPGVYDALTFMKHASLGRPLEVGDKLVVIGAGCSGLDCARTGIRLGARHVTVFDLAAQHELTYDLRDLAEATEEGADVNFRARPERFLGEGGRLRAVELVRVVEAGVDARGRPLLEALPGSEFNVAADAVVVAVSQRPDASWLEGLPQTAKGSPVVDAGGRIGDTKWFAAGDVVSGPRYVSEAIAAGRRAARSMHEFLTGATPPLLTSRFELITQMEAPFGFQEEVTDSLNRWSSGWKPLPAETLVAAEDLPTARWTRGVARRRAFGEEEMERRPVLEPPHLSGTRRDLLHTVDEAYAEGSASAEAQRCLQCQVNIFIEASACVLCGGCVNICPYQALALVRPGDVASIAGSPPDELRDAQNWPFGAAILLDEDRCIRCGLCLTRCPTRAITLQECRLVRAETAVPASYSTPGTSRAASATFELATAP
jgi:NADPH-dependent glutamate synthase beta subunit-like oxidoreductase/ferredoxin